MSLIVTPITYGDALTLADDAMSAGPIPLGTVIVRDRIAKALMLVDQASRAQSGAAELLAALKAVRYELDNDCPQHAAEIADKAILAADPESEPLDNVVARINAAAEKYLDGPGAFYEKRNRGGECGD